MLHSPIDPEQQGATTAANVVYIPTSGGYNHGCTHSQLTTPLMRPYIAITNPKDMVSHPNPSKQWCVLAVSIN